ncbi:MAG TPA: DUF1614 domain-containing protein [Stellaceae bacterium]|nr:DUF1614 domain-containing protein [Stellaceae bacterium]
MDFNKLQYLPLDLRHFSVLAIIWFVVVVWIELRAFRFASMRIGLSSVAALIVLLASLAGSYLNIPVAEFPERQIVTGQIVSFFGMEYVIPMVRDWPGTVIALNVGGAIIPILLSLYLFFRYRLWFRAPIAIAVVTGVCHWLARPVPGLGIALPVFVPPLTAAAVALILSRRHAPALAYIGGSIGCLVGADILNLDKVPGLGAPVASIGGAGTFDGIFLTGVLAVLLASIFSPLGGPPGDVTRGPTHFPPQPSR